MLSWPRRHKIAQGIARGLVHLHTRLKTPLIHGNLTSENIIVYEFYVARLMEFGLHRLTIPVVTEEMITIMEAKGYKVPELQKMNKCNTKTDIYSFGILLLEILLGKKPGRDEGMGYSVDLPTIVKTAVLEEKTMKVLDVEVLTGMRSPMEDGLLQELKLAEAVKQLEENRPRNRSALYNPTDTRSAVDTPF